MQTPILGASYVARSVNAADNRLVNLFPEATADGGKTAGFFNRTPGLQFQQTIGTGPIRALWAHQTNGSDFYVVSGTGFYKITGLTATPTLLGTVTGTGPVSIADNGTQMFLACNPDGYIYNEVTNVFAKITDLDFTGAVTVGYLDGYFVYNEPNSQKVWVTQLLDGTSVDPLDFASAEGSPDGLVAINVNHREAWMFGTDSVEVWYDSGATDFPLTQIQGAFNEIGCVSAFSIAKLDNALFWLGTDARGQGIVYRANGYTGVRVSTHAIEYAIAQYGNISDAIAYTYQQEGHAFYVLTFPTGNATWVYDVSTQVWHERAGFLNGEFTRHRSNCQCNFDGNTIVGDFENGNIYTLDLNIYADNGSIQKWLRSWRALPTGTNNLKRSSQHSLQLDCESGTGLVTGQGNDPEVMLRWSDDGGHTWSNEHWSKMGKIGQYFKRVFWRRLGMTLKLRDRVYEVSGTDPVKIIIVGADLLISPTNA
tara:strand:+ start:377 stop:1819 length:1443 start_codon:yes stop_codon:yes gene_type:complete